MVIALKDKKIKTNRETEIYLPGAQREGKGRKCQLFRLNQEEGREKRFFLFFYFPKKKFIFVFEFILEFLDIKNWFD